MPRWLIYLIVVLVVLSWIPLAFIVRARSATSTKPRLHVVTDMDNQPKYKGQSRNRLFQDRRAMRPQVAGTVARGTFSEDESLSHGRRPDGEWIDVVPVRVTMTMLERGQERYDVYCSPCHGLTGDGNGMVSKRAEELQEGTWTPPSSLHSELVRGRSAGNLFNTITNGLRNMPAYGPQIPVDDRWAIVAYVRVLQRSQNATVEDVPTELREQLR
ncbi:MAG: cytochrome c [bacterium]|nr:cytochrome c [bacterium]